MTFPHLSNFINGKFDTDNQGDIIEIEDPATGKVFHTCARGTVEQMSRAIDNALEGFKQWSACSSEARFHVLLKIASLFRAELPDWALLESRQTGRPLREMKIQLSRLPEWIEYHASLARTYEGKVTQFKGDVVNTVTRVPLGVVGQITPWNHPLLIAIKKIAPALAAGNSVVVKPSELAPLNVLRFADLCVRAGLPAGVLNVVCGYGHEVGVALSTSPKIALIDVTGGTETGRKIAASSGNNLIPCIAELGGKAPVVVFEDCNLQDAINGAAFAAFIASGQTCVCGSRILVHESIYSSFLEGLIKKVAKIKVGDPTLVETGMGPVINQSSLERCGRFVAQAIKEGAKLGFGGERVLLGQGGYFYAPTILYDVERHMQVFQEEVFGPVVAVAPFKTEEEAIELANDSQFGLGASIWTLNIQRSHRVSQRLDVGLCWVNAHHFNDPSSPWGGMKLSGMGRENGREACEAYTQAKSLIISYGASPDWFGDIDARYG